MINDKKKENLVMWKNSRLLFAVKVTLNLSYMRQ